jgi:hypothetical protein
MVPEFAKFDRLPDSKLALDLLGYPIVVAS